MFLENLPSNLMMNIDSIDQQHDQLFKSLNTLIKTLHEHKDNVEPQIIRDLVEDLFKYSKNHFPFEEKKMAKVNYPELTVHLEQHQKFWESIDEIMRAKDKLDFIKLCKVAMFLKEWTKTHINVEDRKLCAFLIEHDR